jgi:hexosaminidase
MYRRLTRTSERLEGLGIPHGKNYEAGLARLAGTAPLPAFKTVVGMLEPVKGYTRLPNYPYTTASPLDRLVDTLLPESEDARLFAADLEAWLAAGRGDMSPMRRRLDMVRGALAALEAHWAKSPGDPQVRSLARDLEEAIKIAHLCLDYFRSGYPVFSSWFVQQHATLDALSKPRGEILIPMIPAVRKLVAGVQNRQTLANLPAAEWSAYLDAELAKREAPAPAH